MAEPGPVPVAGLAAAVGCSGCVLWAWLSGGDPEPARAAGAPAAAAAGSGGAAAAETLRRVLERAGLGREGSAAAASASVLLFHGPIIHALSLGTVEMTPEALLGVNAAGRISFTVDLATAGLSADELAALRGGDIELVELGDRMLIPGFVDAHAHAPQHAFTGTALDLPLLEWLERYTFPHEARFADPEHARKIYTRAVRNHLRNGSTTVSYFATIHNEACKVLVEVCRAAGQRAYVGKVNMDRNSPPSYCEETQQSLRDTNAFVDHVLNLNDVSCRCFPDLSRCSSR